MALCDPVSPPFQVGDKVTTEYARDYCTVIRTVTLCEQDDGFGSGWCVSTDGGIGCPSCGRALATPILYADAAWFKKVEE